MTKNHLIHKYFQKSHLLTVKNPSYRRLLSSLFQWMIDADEVVNDVTTKRLKINGQITAKIICRDNHAVLSGMEELQFLLSEFTKLEFFPLKKDKNLISKNQIVAELKGEASEILAYERTILNILQRMSGISTQTSQLITNTRDSLYLLQKTKKFYIVATRKTPWMRLDKKAVAVGGGLTHRLNLADGILIKDNHLSIIGKAIKTPGRWLKDSFQVEESKELIEVEIESEKQAFAALRCLAELDSASYPFAIMLDNFTPDQAKKTLANLSKEFDLSSIIIEASGGIDEDNINEWVKTGVDILSLGSLTHSAKAANFSLEV